MYRKSYLGSCWVFKNLKATTHWAAMDRLKTWEAISTHARVIETGKIITAAGIDMALVLTAK